MNPRMVLRGIFALGLGLLLSAGAQAQAFRTYLSGSGNDANPCILAAPCRLLPRAIATVIDGGEIWMLDSANYNVGLVNVNKSVTILAVPGALGSVVAKNAAAIEITTAGVKVALRNLAIVPVVGQSGRSGIYMTAGVSLAVDKCLVADMLDYGIYVNANGASVLVTDTVIRDNGYGLSVFNGADATVTRTTVSGGGSGVVAMSNNAGTSTLDMTDSTVEGSQGIGVWANASSGSSTVKVSVRNSQVVRNVYGIDVTSVPGGVATLSASSNVISNNGGSGILAWHSGAKVWASGNTVSNNGVGFNNDAALFETANDNAVRNNGIDTSGAITAIPKM